MLFVTFLLSCSGVKKHTNKTGVLSDVTNIMNQQEQNWNNGNVIGFMDAYWKSDSLRFIGKSGITMGWNKTLSNYQKSYKNKKEMGKLKFSNKSMEFIDEQTIFVIGKWELTRLDSLGNLSGYYSLVWKEKNNEWVIVTDHSS
jgi:ketosteroid isomerase-like protein